MNTRIFMAAALAVALWLSAAPNAEGWYRYRYRYG
jgi:hypothetical protein